jgi:hypothetical protein
MIYYIASFLNSKTDVPFATSQHLAIAPDFSEPRVLGAITKTIL